MENNLEKIPREEIVTRAAVNSCVLEIVAKLGLEDEHSALENARLLYAEGYAAKFTPPEARTDRKKTLARFVDVMTGMKGSIERGDITAADDAALISSTLMNVDIHPSSALRYLSGTIDSVSRRLTPIELVNTLIFHQEFVEGELLLEKTRKDDTEKILSPSPAIIINAADFCGVDLREPVLDQEADIIVANINAFDWTDSIHYADEFGGFRIGYDRTSAALGVAADRLLQPYAGESRGTDAISIVRRVELDTFAGFFESVSYDQDA